MHAQNVTVELALDVTLRPYLNVNIGLAVVQPYLNFLLNHLGDAQYLIYTTQQQLRDGLHHHLTVLTPPEYPSVPVDLSDSVVGYPVRISLLGVGHLSEGDNDVYFIVCECAEIQAMRTYLGLPAADLHITLGFKSADIFDKPKNRATLLSPFSAVEAA